MAGTLTISTLSDGTNSTSSTNCIQGSAKAWVNFNGTGTVAIRSSYNVSSITDNGTGDYTVNFTNALVDANYAMAGAAENVSPYNYPQAVSPNRNVAPTTTALRIYTGFTGSQASLGGLQDSALISVIVFR